jgi:xanthine dehydrogenase YagS FAD-binding subunit
MNHFEYARPSTEGEAATLLAEHDGNTAVLAGGTDLFNLLNRDLVAPARLVDLKSIPSLGEVTETLDGVRIGAAVTLDTLARHPLLAGRFAALHAVIDGIHSIQVQSMGTLAGDLCLAPNCWYYRSGYGLLAMRDGESLVETGRNEHHAILGNRGPAKFVSASRFAPALIALGARLRIVGPSADEVTLLPVEAFFVSPKTDRQGTTVLRPGQFISHVEIPADGETRSATYEVLQTEGLDWPMATASVSAVLSSGVVRSAQIVMGHVAPTPWIAHSAAQALVGQRLTEETAASIADLAVAPATPLSENEYKVQIARTAVKRALLRLAEQTSTEGGVA